MVKHMVFIQRRTVLKKQDEAHEPECSHVCYGTDVKTHGYAVTHNIFLQKFI